MKKNTNRMIIVTGCFIDCPCSRYENGGGFTSPFWKCNMMDKLIQDGDDYKISKWHEKLEIHPDCPLKKTNIAKPMLQTFTVKDKE